MYFIANKDGEEKETKQKFYIKWNFWVKLLKGQELFQR